MTKLEGFECEILELKKCVYFSTGYIRQKCARKKSLTEGESRSLRLYNESRRNVLRYFIRKFQELEDL